MGLLSELSKSASMTPDQANQMLSWVNEMLSKNLYPQERQRFSRAKQELEVFLKSQQRHQRRDEAQGLLSELIQRQNPNRFLGEGIVKGPGIPEGSYNPKHSHIGPELINPRDYRKPLYSIIRNIQPNPSWGDRMVIDPGSPRQWRYRGI